MDKYSSQDRVRLIAAYYAGLVLMLPGAALALLSYLFRGTLGDTLKDLGKVFSFLSAIDDLFPRDWGWQWGFGVLVLLCLLSLAAVFFIGVAGIMDRCRPYAAAILFIAATVSLSTLLRSEGFRATEVAWFCFVITPISILASGYVMWKTWVKGYPRSREERPE